MALPGSKVRTPSRSVTKRVQERNSNLSNVDYQSSDYYQNASDANKARYDNNAYRNSLPDQKINFWDQITPWDTQNEAYIKDLKLRARLRDEEISEAIREEEYNSPVEQANRMALAGINPHLSGNVTPGEAAQNDNKLPAPSAPFGIPEDIKSLVGGIGSVVSSMIGVGSFLGNVNQRTFDNDISLLNALGGVNGLTDSLESEGFLNRLDLSRQPGDDIDPSFIDEDITPAIVKALTKRGFSNKRASSLASSIIANFDSRSYHGYTDSHDTSASSNEVTRQSNKEFLDSTSLRESQRVNQALAAQNEFEQLEFSGEFFRENKALIRKAQIAEMRIRSIEASLKNYELKYAGESYDAVTPEDRKRVTRLKLQAEAAAANLRSIQSTFESNLQTKIVDGLSSNNRYYRRRANEYVINKYGFDPTTQKDYVNSLTAKGLLGVGSAALAAFPYTRPLAPIVYGVGKEGLNMAGF